MSVCIGLILFFGLIGGGVFLYLKVERLEQEIAKQSAPVEGEDDSV